MQVETGRLRVVAPEDSGPVLTQTDSPSPGRFIREQRKRRGMSVEQLAAATKIPPRSVELLESDRYEGLPGPVFVKGFLRCAARALGVEPQAVLDLLYERERAALAARRRPSAATNEPREAQSLRVPRGRRLSVGPAAWPSVPARVGRLMPSASIVLWCLVVAFVALLVLAAFNLMGAGPTSAPT